MRPPFPPSRSTPLGLRLPRLFPRADRKRRGGTRSKDVSLDQPPLPRHVPLRLLNSSNCRGSLRSPALTGTALARSASASVHAGASVATGCTRRGRGRPPHLRFGAGVAPRPGRRRAGASPRGERPAGQGFAARTGWGQCRVSQPRRRIPQGSLGDSFASSKHGPSDWARRNPVRCRRRSADVSRSNASRICFAPGAWPGGDLDSLWRGMVCHRPLAWLVRSRTPAQKLGPRARPRRRAARRAGRCLAEELVARERGRGHLCPGDGRKHGRLDAALAGVVWLRTSKGRDEGLRRL